MLEWMNWFLFTLVVVFFAAVLLVPLFSHRENDDYGM